jgi:hypothetical protein
MVSDTTAWQEQPLHGLSWSPALPVSASLMSVLTFTVALPKMFRNVRQVITCSNQKLNAHFFKQTLISAIS